MITRSDCTPSRRMRPLSRRAVLVSLALAVGALGLAGCASVRNELGTAQSECYIALPAATDAVHNHGHLRGVRLTTVASLHKYAPGLYQAAITAPKPKVTEVCLFAYNGNFTSAGLSDPIGETHGHLAVVELAYPSKRLLATLLINHFNLSFGHPHI